MIPRFEQGMRIVEEPDFRNRLNEVVDAVNDLQGQEPLPGQVFHQEEAKRRLIGRITSSTLVPGQNLAWAYTVQPVKPATTSSTWPLLVDDGAQPTITAYNLSEMINPVSMSAGGLTGTGVTVSTGSPSCPMKPVAGHVEYWSITTEDGNTVYVFGPFPNTFSNV